MGTRARQEMPRHTGRSICRAEADTGMGRPETREQMGSTRDMSMMLAPMILPTDRPDSFLTMEVMVVTSSGREVPTAMRVTAMRRSGTPRRAAISLPLLTMS